MITFCQQRLADTAPAFWLRDGPYVRKFLPLLYEACNGITSVEIISTGSDPKRGIGIDLVGAISLPAATKVWSFETQSGRPLLGRLTHAASWCRPPYVAAVRLVSYPADSLQSDLLDEAVVSTRTSYRELVGELVRTAGHLMRRAVRAGSAQAAQPPVPAERNRDTGWGLLGGLARWSLDRGQAALFTDHWDVGVSEQPIEAALATGQIDAVKWTTKRPGSTYFADPFLWPGRDRILCEELPYHSNVGRIVSLKEYRRGEFIRDQVVLNGGSHLSYPFTFTDHSRTYCVPESSVARRTVIYEIFPDGRWQPVSAILAEMSVADCTLFRANDLYWVAYIDLDIGRSNNLCMASADQLSGPWRPHPMNPVKIDVRSSRPGGTPFWYDGALYRPAQDNTYSYGCAIVINKVLLLTPEAYSEMPVCRLAPDKNGPYPDGLHTLAAAGSRTLIDGKRRIIRPVNSVRKITRRLAGLIGSTSTSTPSHSESSNLR